MVLPKAPVWTGLAGMAAATLYAAFFLGAESQVSILVLLLVGCAGGFWLLRAKGEESVETGKGETSLNVLAVVSMLVIFGVFHEDHFTLLMVVKVMLFVMACLGLNIQLGYAGVVNFAGAAFFGIGCYTSAMLTLHTGVPALLVIFIGGLVSALVGSILILPILRTRGHYAALITIAFGILFKTFLEVNSLLGGPQGLKVGPMRLFGWNFNDNMSIGDLDLSFYLSYGLLALVLVGLSFAFTRRLERSWIGLNFDAVRLDETASACFGIDVAKWKIVAFTFGNFLIGAAGGLYAMMMGFIAPNNFTFGDSLILVSIVVLGGLGNPWGLAVAASFVLVLPEKLQVIQEYRFMLYSVVVILILLFRPEGLIPRPLRAYFPAWRDK